MTLPAYDDLRFLLAVAETGTTLAAAARLGVSQSTVSRRIAALEASLKLELFEKRRSGYVLTGAGERLLEPAAAVRTAAEQFLATVGSLSRDVSGTVRFTTNEVLAGLFVPELVRRLKASHPQIHLDIDTSNILRDLKGGEADIALRAAAAPVQPDLVGVKLADDHWSLYCADSYARRHGIPRSIKDLTQHSLIGLDPHGRHHQVVEWARLHFPPDCIMVRQNSIPTAFSSIADGVGVGFFSDLLAARRQDLVLCFRPDLPPAAEVWLLTHDRLRHVPRIRAVLDLMKDLFREHFTGMPVSAEG
jgi:DNA-binding transcriptional LysR family regulator